MLSSFKRILNKNQRWIDKKVKRMRPSEATMFEATVRVAINFVLDIDEIPKEAKTVVNMKFAETPVQNKEFSAQSKLHNLGSHRH